MTPVFKSSSNHKYNTEDYYEIDPDFGTKTQLKELVEKAHEKGIKIILDAVFNHSGTDFFAFKDCHEKGEKSKYKDWFEAESFPLKMDKEPNYKTFGYFYGMPKVILGNEETAEYFLDVAEYWIKETDVDGWRLDVADEISHNFWREARKRIKKIKSDAVIIGEVWYDSTSWLMGDQFDSVMNYYFYYPMIDFFAKEIINAEEFADKIGYIRGLYKLPAYNVLWNLIDSHDTPRFLHEAEGKMKKQKMAAMMQMTYTGTPVIYYGDEIGMNGGADPDNRRPMKWNHGEQEREMFEYYKKLISLRKTNPVFTRGDFEIIVKEGKENIFAFRRKYEGKTVTVYFNNGKEDYKIKIEKTLKDMMTDEVYEKEYILKPDTSVILEEI